MLRPHNFPDGTPGSGASLFTLASGLRVVVVNVMLRLFMDPLDDPFACVERFVQGHKLCKTADAILVDAHGEASSEKQALGHMLDGRVTVVIGSHTHVPTADTRILPKGTGFQTDAGMCGDYDSVIGMNKTNSLNRFLKKDSTKHFPAEGNATLCGIIVECDTSNGLAKKAEPFIFKES